MCTASTHVHAYMCVYMCELVPYKHDVLLQVGGNNSDVTQEQHEYNTISVA